MFKSRTESKVGHSEEKKPAFQEMLDPLKMGWIKIGCSIIIKGSQVQSFSLRKFYLFHSVNVMAQSSLF